MSGHEEEENEDNQNEECEDGWCGVQMMFNQSKHMFEDKKDWILLDSGSTVGLFHNEDLVKNMRKTNRQLELATNVGTKKNDNIADVPG